jgi:hypothetical protein
MHCRASALFSERSGRPLGRESFVVALEGNLGRTLQRGKLGLKRGTAA